VTRPEWTAEELDGADIEWLIDLTFAGHVVRASTAQIVVSSDAGDLQYAGGASRPMWKRALSLFDSNPEAEQIPLDFPVHLDVPGLCASGHRLAFSPVSVAQVRVRNGVVLDTWEERYVVLTGRASSARYTVRGYGEDEAVSSHVFITAERPVWDGPGLVPLPAQEVSEETWEVSPTTLSSEDTGVAYAVAFGYPGKDPLVPAGWITAGRVFWLRKSELFHVAGIALGRIGASTAMLNTDADPYGQEVNLDETYTDGGGTVPARDELGCLLTVVDMAAYNYDDSGDPAYLGDSYAPAVSDATAVYVALPEGGGMLGPGGSVVRGAGDVLRYMLERTGLPVDFAAVGVAAPVFNTYNIDCFVDAHVSPMEWITTYLAPILPMTIVSTERGLAPLAWIHHAGRHDAVVHIDADTDPRLDVGDTVSEEETGDLLNLFSLKYAYSRRVGKFQHKVRLGPTAVPSTTYAIQQILSTNAAGPARINIRAATRGQAGAGIRITLTDTGAETYTEDTALKTVDITFDGVANTSATTTATLYALIASGTLLTASYDAADAAIPWLETVDQPVTTLISDFGTRANALCAASKRMMAEIDAPGPDAGIRRDDIESRVIYDAGTAARVLDWRAAAFAMPPRRIELAGPVVALAGLRLGDYVTFTSTPHAFDRELGIVEAIDTDGITSGVRLVFMEAHRHAV
jgi:hypothetical protein